jgi:hypothetical protein
MFVPNVQPMPHFFLIVELNGYNETLLLIDEKGKIREVPAREFLVDIKRRLLFLETSPADDPLSHIVLDLDSGKTVFQGVEEDVYSWYHLDSVLFFTAARAAGLQSEDRTTGYFYDATKKTVRSRSLTPKMWSRAEPVERDFDPRRYQDCTSEERRYGLER